MAVYKEEKALLDLKLTGKAESVIGSVKDTGCSLQGLDCCPSDEIAVTRAIGGLLAVILGVDGYWYKRYSECHCSQYKLTGKFLLPCYHSDEKLETPD